MTFAPLQFNGYRCRTKPDSTPWSGRVKGRCALESAAARTNRASGLGRYLSEESASCGLGCRAPEAIKTCRLELTDTRIWVSSVLCSPLIVLHLFLIFRLSDCVGCWKHTLVVLLSHNTPSNALTPPLWISCLHQKMVVFLKRTVETANKGVWVSFVKWFRELEECDRILCWSLLVAELQYIVSSIFWRYGLGDTEDTCVFDW